MGSLGQKNKVKESRDKHERVHREGRIMRGCRGLSWLLEEESRGLDMINYNGYNSKKSKYLAKVFA